MGYSERSGVRESALAGAGGCDSAARVRQEFERRLERAEEKGDAAAYAVLCDALNVAGRKRDRILYGLGRAAIADVMENL